MASLRQNEKVLLVDDEVAVRNLYQAFLENHGLTVFTAAGVKEALKALHDLDFDVAVIDLQLTDGNGIDIVRRVRNEGAPKLVAMSGFTPVSEASEELKRGGVQLYNKLEPLSELVRLISIA